MACTHGSDIDDITLILILLQKHLDGLSHGVQRTIGVDPEQSVNHLIGHIADGGIVVHNTGVVHQHIQSAKFLNCRIDHTFTHGRIGYITGIGHYLAGGIL